MLAWILSRPDCALVNTLMQEFTNTRFESSEQHKEIGKARYKRDWKDIDQVVSFLKEGSPFSREFFPLIFVKLEC